MANNTERLRAADLITAIKSVGIRFIVGSDIHVMLVKRFRVTVDQQRLPSGRRSTEIYGHPRGLSPVQVSRV